MQGLLKSGIYKMGQNYSGKGVDSVFNEGCSDDHRLKVLTEDVDNKLQGKHCTERKHKTCSYAQLIPWVLLGL